MSKRDAKPMADENDPDWQRFWDAYPKRVGKKDARAAWTKLNPTSAQVDQMIATLAWQCHQPSWVKEGGQYIPFPASWLRAERWTDAPLQVQPKAFGSAAEHVLRILGA